MKPFTSNAQYAKGSYYMDVTQDEHDTQDQAEHVCAKLMIEGNDFGETTVYPIRTWVKDESGVILRMMDYTHEQLNALGIDQVEDLLYLVRYGMRFVAPTLVFKPAGYAEIPDAYRVRKRKRNPGSRRKF